MLQAAKEFEQSIEVTKAKWSKARPRWGMAQCPILLTGSYAMENIGSKWKRLVALPFVVNEEQVRGVAGVFDNLTIAATVGGTVILAGFGPPGVPSWLLFVLFLSALACLVASYWLRRCLPLPRAPLGSLSSLPSLHSSSQPLSPTSLPPPSSSPATLPSPPVLPAVPTQTEPRDS